MVVDEVVSASLRRQPPLHTAIFVASCTERAAQLFTGLRNVAGQRAADTEILVRLLDDLWDPDLESTAFSEPAASLAAFPELQSRSEEIVDPSEIYSSCAVLIAHYATLFRWSGDVNEALKCAHMSLTVTHQMDSNGRTENAFSEENQCQLSDVSATVDRSTVADVITALRSRDTAISRQRYLALRNSTT